MYKTEIANALLIMKQIYSTPTLRLDAEDQKSQIIRLNDLGLLSLDAIQAVVRTTKYRVAESLRGQTLHGIRGRLNPDHIDFLLYMLTQGKVNNAWLKRMVANGTSINTIATFTNISKSTLHRHLEAV